MDNVLIIEAAEAEYKQAMEWYQARDSEAADNFEYSFMQGISAISKQPEIFTPLDHLYRFYLLKDYPYRLIYRITSPQRIVIVSVSHTSREPDHWRRR